MLKRILISLTFLFLCPFLQGEADETSDVLLLTKLQECNEPENRPRIQSILREAITLIQEGADLSFQDENGLSCFGYINYLISTCDPDPIYDELITAVAETDVDYFNLDSDRSVFNHAGLSCQISRYLNNGIKPLPDDIGALEQAVYVGEPKRLDLLLNAGINPEIPLQHRDNATVLMVAADHNNYEAVAAFLSRQKKYDQRNADGLTALHYAINGISMKLNPTLAREKFWIIQALIEKGIPINCVDKEGATPLIYAIKEHEAHDEQPDQKLINLIISSGADPLQKDKHGLSALHYASHKRLNKLITAILYAITLYSPEKLSAAEGEIHVPISDLMNKHETRSTLTTYAYTALDFARKALATYGFIKTIVDAKLCLQKKTRK